jgi:hypothetical protein
MLPSLPWQVVVVRVLSDSSVHECPSDPIDRVLFALYGPSDDIRIQMILKAVVKLRLNRERLLQELDEVLFLRSVTVEDASCLGGGSATGLDCQIRSSHHLKHVRDRVFNTFVLLPIEPLSVEDNDEM